MAPIWTPRDEAWHARAPSPFAGAPARPLFIGACPRSGTTLLRLMLDNHPELAMPRETNFVRPLWWQRQRFGDLRDRANRRAVARFIFTRHAGGPRLRDGIVPRRRAIRRVVNAPPTLGSLVEAAFRVYADAHDKPRWGDKRPAYSGFIGMLFAMFPDAQYVNVVRDPRGAVASQVPMGWDPPADALYAAIARWDGAIRRTDHFARGLRPDQVLDVRYEDLVRDPRAALDRVCAFAGLRAGDEVLDTMIGAPRGEYEGRFERLGQPVTTASIERWRERLEPAEAALVEHALAPAMARFGYLPAPGLDAAPTRAALRQVRWHRVLNRREWRQSQRGELLRRVRYRSPVAAAGRSQPK